MAQKTKKADFESSIEQLEEIVRQLDSGNAGLEASLQLYEKGIRLVRECTKTLDEAEQKVKILSMQPDGTAVLTDADDEEDAE